MGRVQQVLPARYIVRSKLLGLLQRQYGRGNYEVAVRHISEAKSRISMLTFSCLDPTRSMDSLRTIRAFSGLFPDPISEEIYWTDV